MADTEYAQFAAFADKLADAAGAAIRPYFRQPIAIDTKSDSSPVTIADRAAEKAMRALIATHYPSHGIFGEEYGVERADAEYVWVLDPIDGTKAFITGMPVFGTLIGLMRRGRAVVGIIDQPISKERWLGVSGRQTTWNNTPVHVREDRSIATAVLYTTATDMYPPPDLQKFDRLRAQAQLTRYSADCYASGLLASGYVDIVVECGVKLYDYAALIPVIEGAGGVITDWQGKPLGFESDGRMLATASQKLHGEVRQILC